MAFYVSASILLPMYVNRIISGIAMRSELFFEDWIGVRKLARYVTGYNLELKMTKTHRLLTRIEPTTSPATGLHSLNL